MPKRLKKRPKFRGLPIPFTTFVKSDGTPDFKVTDQKTWAVCILTKRCGLCGEKLLNHEYYFIGGEISCGNGVFYDPPMHKECAHYAFQVCPFLACEKGYSKAPPTKVEGVTITVDPNMLPHRPAKMGILLTTDWAIVPIQNGHYFKIRDIVSIEWRD